MPQSYVDKLSEDLQAEYGRQGITVQCVLPGVVATNMSKVRRATWMAPTPDQFVESALKRVGILQKTPGYYPHSLLVSRETCRCRDPGTAGELLDRWEGNRDTSPNSPTNDVLPELSTPTSP